MILSTRSFQSLLLFALTFLIAAPLQSAPLEPLSPGSLKVGGEIGRRIDATIENNLLRIDFENDFLAPFREKNRTGGFIGLGMLIDSVVRLAAYSGDARVLELKDRLIREAISTQEADGYVGIMAPESRIWKLWDIHEMSYLIQGFVADYELFNATSSLNAAKKIADHIIERWSADPDREPGGGDITVYMGVTGSEPAMLSLYEITGERRYLDYCLDLRKLGEWDGPIVRGRWGQIRGHTYAYMSRAIARRRLHRLFPEAAPMSASSPAQKALDFLTRKDGLVVTGTCGDHECWHDTQEGSTNLGETCGTAYVIRFMDDFLREESNPYYGDLMERAIHNALFAAQSPDGRKIRYYSPFDGPRVYFDKDTYCCPCNYRRVLSELPGMVFYRKNGGVLVNLYTPSTAEMRLGDGDDKTSFRIEQVTDYPREDNVVLRIGLSEIRRFPLFLRIPRWCEDARVSINGLPFEEKKAAPGSFLEIDREWREGDRIDLELPMKWRLVKGRKAQAGRVAILRGPLVFCLNPSRNEGLEETDPRLITIDPETLEGPFREEEMAFGGGMTCHVKAWGPGVWYPFSNHDLSLTLTEYPDPEGAAVYFKTPDPNLAVFVEDELVLRD